MGFSCNQIDREIDLGECSDRLRSLSVMSKTRLFAEPEEEFSASEMDQCVH